MVVWVYQTQFSPRLSAQGDSNILITYENYNYAPAGSRVRCRWRNPGWAFAECLCKSLLYPKFLRYLNEPYKANEPYEPQQDVGNV